MANSGHPPGASTDHPSGVLVPSGLGQNSQSGSPGVGPGLTPPPSSVPTERCGRGEKFFAPTVFMRAIATDSPHSIRSLSKSRHRVSEVTERRMTLLSTTTDPTPTSPQTAHVPANPSPPVTSSTPAPSPPPTAPSHPTATPEKNGLLRQPAPSGSSLR